MKKELHLPPSVVYYADSEVFKQCLQQNSVEDLVFFYESEFDGNVCKVVIWELVKRCQELDIKNLLWVLRAVMMENHRYERTVDLMRYFAELESELTKKLQALEDHELWFLFQLEGNRDIRHQMALELAQRYGENVRKGDFEMRL